MATTQVSVSDRTDDVMVFKTLRGQARDISIKRYLVDWGRKVSGPQKLTKDFLRPYWEHDIVLEEAPLVGTRSRIDLINANKNVMVEVSPESSHSYNAFFHGGSLNRFKDALKRDLSKDDYARVNGFTLVTLTDTDFPLTPEAFARQGVIL